MPNPNKHEHQQTKTTSEPSEGKYPTELADGVSVSDEVQTQMRAETPETPRQRAVRFVRENAEMLFFEAPTTSRKVADAVKGAIDECPEADRVAFRDEGKKVIVELKQFGEMLFNEFVYQTSIIK